MKLWTKVEISLGAGVLLAVAFGVARPVAGVRGTTFRVDAHTDKSVLVRVYAGAVAVAKNVPIYASGKPEARHEVAGPDEVNRETWEKLVGKQMQIVIAADGTPGEPTQFAAEDEKDDEWAKWNEKRDEAAH